MNKFTQAVKNFWNDEEGLTVIEYVVGAGLLVAGITTLFSSLGEDLETKLDAIVASITPASA